MTKEELGNAIMINVMHVAMLLKRKSGMTERQILKSFEQEMVEFQPHTVKASLHMGCQLLMFEEKKSFFGLVKRYYWLDREQFNTRLKEREHERN